MLFFNGVNGDLGGYDLPPLSPAELCGIIRGAEPPSDLAELQRWNSFRKQNPLGVPSYIDPNRLDQAGWGVVFPAGSDPSIKEALQPLLDRRAAQAGEVFHRFEGSRGYRPGLAKRDFLAENAAGPGPANPKKIPYYLLLAGSPQEIPFEFQTQMDVQYSVGRVYFETAQEYANYADSVVKAETCGLVSPPRLDIFGVQNDDDPATQVSASMLVKPLLEQAADGKPDWTINALLGGQATKARLSQALGGDPAQTPALLFTASHGMAFPCLSPRQFSHQGALLCQDWPGPEKWGKPDPAPIPEDFYFSGDDILSTSSLLGMVAFFFACYSLGAPSHDPFSPTSSTARPPVAPQPFLANLPLKMLANPGSGALAVIGYLDRACGYSFKFSKQGDQVETFTSTLLALMGGLTVGYAVECFNERYAELAAMLTAELEQIEFKKTYDPLDLAGLWAAQNDARAIAILGDPAVRLPVAARTANHPQG